MSIFSYVAIKPDGTKTKGSLEAVNETELRQLVRDQGLVPIKIKETNSLSKIKKSSYSIKPKQRSILFRTLATLVGPDLPLDQALGVAIEQTDDKSLKKMISSILKSIREGKKLSSALKEYPKSFPSLYLASIQASEESGNLNKVLNKLADHSENHYSNNQKVKLAMLYPLILVTLSIMITGYLIGFIMPDIIDAYKDQSQSLPTLTSMMMVLSNFLVGYWQTIVAAVATLVFSYKLAVKNQQIRMNVDAFKLRLPILGRVIKVVEVTNYVSTLSMLVNSGITLSQAMQISNASVVNKEIKRKLDLVLNEVERGKPFSTQLRKTKLIPHMMMHLIETGEKSERLGAMLEKAHVEQSKEIQNTTNAAIALINPILLIFMGGVVMLIAMAIMLPIMNMSSFIS